MLLYVFYRRGTQSIFIMVIQNYKMSKDKIRIKNNTCTKTHLGIGELMDYQNTNAQIKIVFLKV